MLVQLQQAKVLPCPILSRHHLLNACNLACYNLNRSFANTKLYSRCAIVYSHLPCRFFRINNLAPGYLKLALRQLLTDTCNK